MENLHTPSPVCVCVFVYMYIMYSTCTFTRTSIIMLCVRILLYLLHVCAIYIYTMMSKTMGLVLFYSLPPLYTYICHTGLLQLTAANATYCNSLLLRVCIYTCTRIVPFVACRARFTHPPASRTSCIMRRLYPPRPASAS